MNLINNMAPDEQGGVCLKKYLHYNTYSDFTSGCTCNESVDLIEEYIPTGLYVLPYINDNHSYTVNTGDTSLCLVLINISMADWFVNYINTLATTGYTGYNGSTIENRIIFDLNSEEYYKVSQSNLEICSGDTSAKWAIIDYETNNLWYSGSTTFYYDELDDCDVKTCNRLVKMKDINPKSLTYNQIKIINKCKNETTPIVSLDNITGITTSSATLFGTVISDGGFEILDRGFYYSTDRLPSSNSTKVSVNGTIGEFNAVINGLKPLKYYYVMAYATNCLGTSYSESIVFVIIQCNCPDGYSLSEEVCTITTGATHVEGSSIKTKHYTYTTYGEWGAIFYKPDNFNQDGTWDITRSLPNTYLRADKKSNLLYTNNYSTTNNLWVNMTSASSTSQGRLNRTGMWDALNALTQGVLGFTRYFNVPTDSTYYIGFGSDNQAKVQIDGVTVIDQNIATMSASNYFNAGSPDNIPYKFWFMYPVTLSANHPHYITISANNTGSLGILGCEIYNGTEEQLISCISNSGSTSTSLSQYVLFSTAPKGTFNDPNIGVNDDEDFQVGTWICPEGWQLTSDDNITYYCKKSELLEDVKECPGEPPKVEIISISGITVDSATITYKIHNYDNSSIIETGVKYGITEDINTWSTKTMGPDITVVTLTGLTSNTTYYLKAFGLNGIGYGYSIEDSFKTNIACNLSIQMSSTAATNPANNNGTATATVSNGTAPYTYLWSNGQTTSTAINLSGGTDQSVTVRDANNCEITGTITVGGFSFSADYMVLTYAFTDGKDLDTRSGVLVPDIGQNTHASYLGYGANSVVYPSGFPSATPIIYWGGDNQGTGKTDYSTSESILLNFTNLELAYPGQDTIVIDCRAWWYSINGVNPVLMSCTLYKGGEMIKTGYTFTNTTYDSKFDVESASKVITTHYGGGNGNGERLATLTYTISTGNGYFNLNDTRPEI